MARSSYIFLIYLFNKDANFSIICLRFFICVYKIFICTFFANLCGLNTSKLKVSVIVVAFPAQDNSQQVTGIRYLSPWLFYVPC